MRYLSFLLLLTFLLNAGCNTHSRKEGNHSFYYWKTNKYEDTVSQKEIKKLGINHFYIHYLDVDWSESRQMPVPVAAQETDGHDFPYASGPYTPVVFITNRTFERISDAWCDTLAGRVAEKVNSISKGIENTMILLQSPDFKWDSPYYTDEYHRIKDSLENIVREKRAKLVEEIQIDCDWTASTRDRYFHFLKAIKARFPDKTISATIRLYPYKYRKNMGVPPVDRGMLMCYNMGNIKQAGTANSVFDPATLKSYLNVRAYPLPLDIALPVFGWYAWFRGGTFKGILYKSEGFDPVNWPTFKPFNPNRYLVTTDTVVGRYYLREGDVLRQEFIQPEELIKAADLLTGKLPSYGRIAFYHWDYPEIRTYEKAIQSVYQHH